MRDGDDFNEYEVVNNSVQHAVLAASSREEGIQRWRELLAHPVGIVRQRTIQECEDRSGDGLGQNLCQRSSS